VTPFHRRRQPTADDRLDAELRDHLERYVADLRASGLDEAEARRQARLDLGGMEQAKDACRDVRPFRWLGEFLGDVRLGFRSYRRDLLFSGAVGAILAVGTGTTLMMFSVLHTIVLRPLPYSHPEELVVVSTHLMLHDQPDGTSLANLFDWRAQSRSFADITFYRRTSVSAVTIGGLDSPQRAQEGLVGPEFFDLLGTAPLIGRTFSREEFERAEALVVLSEGVWQERFAGASDAIGRTLPIDGRDHVVIGVMPRSFQLPARDTRLWRPISLMPLWSQAQTVRDSDQFEVLGRLKPGISLEQARTEMRAIAASLRQAHAADQNVDIRIYPLLDQIVPPRTQRGVWLGFAAVLCLLLTACANVGGLFAARAARRRLELTVRAALGAGRIRLVRQLLAESISLWAVASIGGVVLAHVLVKLLVAYGPRALPRIDETGIDPAAVFVAVTGSLVVVVGCGIFPALSAARVGAASFATRAPGAEQRRRLQDVLVTAQIAAALVLVVGALLFAQSFVRANAEDPGYPADELLIVRLDLPRPAYSGRGPVSTFFSQARERLGRLPGVIAVGGITDFFIRRNVDQSVTVKGRPAGREEGAPRLAAEGVTPGFFRAAGIELQEGRDFNDGDYESGAPGVFIVTESLARRFWPGESAVGKQMVGGDSPPKDGKWSTVIGVVKDFRRESLDVAPILGAFIPAFPRSMDLIVRASVDSSKLIPSVREEIRALDRALPITSLTTADGRLSERLEGRRFDSQLLVAFSGIAVLLSAAGLYALLAYEVMRRKREIAVRSALGADRRAIVALVLVKGLRLAILGATLGITLAGWSARVIQSLLYETSALDAPSYAAAALIVLLIATMAAAIPAIRAARVSPMAVLREQ
jgi:putative ABC transport system permease protein